MEILVILLVLILVFGASRLPKLGRGLGEGLRGFKEALRGDDERPTDLAKRNDDDDDDKKA